LVDAYIQQHADMFRELRKQVYDVLSRPKPVQYWAEVQI